MFPEVFRLAFASDVTSGEDLAEALAQSWGALGLSAEASSASVPSAQDLPEASGSAARTDRDTYQENFAGVSGRRCDLHGCHAFYDSPAEGLTSPRRPCFLR